MKIITSIIVLIISIAFIIGIAIVNLCKYNTYEYGNSIHSNDKNYIEYLQLRNPSTGEIPRNIRQLSLRFVQDLPGSKKNIKTKYDKLLANRWVQRGPSNIGGRTRALAIDISNENRIIAGGVSSGMWLSTDGGFSWSRTTTLEQLSSVSCIAQDRRYGKQNIWYYGTGELLGNSASISGDGIYKSTDGGNSWFVLPSTVRYKPDVWENSFDYVWNIATNPINENEDEVLCAFASGGICRSTDGGDSWNIVLGGLSNRHSLYTDIAISSQGIYYATLSQASSDKAGSLVKGIFRSVDGINWTNITPQNFPEKYTRVVIGIAPSDENQVYFLGETPGFGKLSITQNEDSTWHSLWKYTYISGNGSGDGGFWEDRSDNLPCPDYRRGRFQSQHSYDLVIKVKPDDPDVVFIGGTNLYRSNDGFTRPDTWNWAGGYCPYGLNCPDLAYINHHPDLHAIEFLPSNPEIMFTGSDGGIHKTMNCLAQEIEWLSLNNSYFTTQFYTIALNHNNSNSEEIIGGLQDNGTLYTSSDNAIYPWTRPTYNDGFHCAIDGEKHIYYTSMNTFYQPKVKIWKVTLTETGEKKTQTRIDPIGGKDFIWNTPFVLDPNNNNIMYLAGGEIIWRNNDLSAIPNIESKDSISTNWDSLPSTRVSPAKITAIAISKNPANILYYGTWNGKLFKLVNANQNDSDPIEISSPSFPKNAYISSIAFDPNNADEVIVAFSNYGVVSIFRTIDGGANWTPISGNLEENENGSGSGPAVFTVKILNVMNRNMYFAGTSVGLFSTAYIDGTKTAWQFEGAETIGNTVVKMLDARQSDGLVAVATHGLGVFTAKINTLPDIASPPELIFPDDYTRGILDTITFRWKKVHNAGYYHIQIARDYDFNEIIRDIDGIRTDNVYITNLELGRKEFYWRVRTRSAGGISGFSTIYRFTTIHNPPELIEPEANADSIPTDVQLIWEKLDYATSYRVQLGSLAFSTIYLDTLTNQNSITLKNLENGKRYYWRVSAINSEGESKFSPNRRFTTISNTSIYIPLIAASPKLKIQPNPVKDIAKITFSTDYNLYVQLNLFNQEGEKIKTILNDFVNSGNHIIYFDFSNLAQGIYFLKMIYNNSFTTEKILIIK